MITDEMIAAAAKELSLVMSATFPDTTKEIHDFSLSFKWKMKRLINKTIYPTRHLWVQRVACFILVSFIGFMVIFATSPTVRASVIGWIRKQYESYVEYFFPSELSAEQKDRFEITLLPEGFEEISLIDEDAFCLVEYSDSSGNKIDFVYSKDPEAGNMMVESEGSTIYHTYVHHYEADLYLPDNPNNATSIIWYDTQNNTMFYISTICSADEIVQIAESIK